MLVGARRPIRSVRCAGILVRMPDRPKIPPMTGGGARLSGEGSLTAGGTIAPAAQLSGVGMLTATGIRAAVQDLHDSSVEELKRLLAEFLAAQKAEGSADVSNLAAEVETTTRMVSVARVLRAGAKWGIATIIAGLIGIGIEHEANDFMGWTPPSITIVQQMSPAQMDELSREIMHQIDLRRGTEERDPPADPGR
jgi:hypothetical protein